MLSGVIFFRKRAWKFWVQLIHESLWYCTCTSTNLHVLWSPYNTCIICNEININLDHCTVEGDMPKCLHYPGVHSQTTYFIHKETWEDIFNGNKMFQWYLKLWKHNSHLSWYLGEICTINQVKISTALNHCFGFLHNCDCNKFKLWKPYTCLLTPYSQTKINFFKCYP